MLYNGVELPDIETVWTGDVKEAYPYVWISNNPESGHPIQLRFFSCPVYIRQSDAGELTVYPTETQSSYKYYILSSTGNSWTTYKEANLSSQAGLGSANIALWSNHNIINGVDGTVYLAASIPATPNEPTLPDSTVTNAALTIETIHAGDDFMSSAVSVSDLGSTDTIYNLRANLSTNGEVISTVDSDTFAGPFMYWHITKTSLTPETEYTLEYVLLENGEEASVSASETFTTLAAEADDPVDDTETLSLLSAILAAIGDQNDRQEQEHESLLTTLSSLWIRLRYIEEFSANIWESVKALAPSAEETALKEASKETTQAVTDSLYADDAPTKVTASDVKDVATSGNAVVNTFDTGTTVGDFFSVFSDYVFTGWFSEETRANLDSVNAVSTFGLGDDPYNHDSYNKNMEALDKFLERSGK